PLGVDDRGLGGLRPAPRRSGAEFASAARHSYKFDPSPKAGIAKLGAMVNNDDAIQFMLQFRRHPRSVGAILPSSRELAERMGAPIDFARASPIVEFGPGAGVFTAAIARNLRHHSRYLGIEINDAFHKTLTARFPHLAFFHRSAEHVEDILAEQGIDAADAIV